jgi:ankyrin repeat/BTB/POZ domain-containing protein 1
LNDRIRNLLLKYDFSKSSDPFVYWSSHISTLLTRTLPQTSDIAVQAGSQTFALHKFLLSSRTPYFRKKLEAQPETSIWNAAATVPVEAIHIAMRYIYLGDLPRDLVPPGSSVSEEEVAKGLDKISKQLEVDQLWEAIMAGSDRRLARQRYQDEVGRALARVSEFFERSVLGHKMVVDTDRVDEVKWKHDNFIFADVILRSDYPAAAVGGGAEQTAGIKASSSFTETTTNGNAGIPVGPAQPASQAEKSRKSVLYPAHKAMLIRSEYFNAMFSGDFVESRKTDTLHIVTVDCAPEVLELVLTFLYTENAACPLEHALDLLYAADMLFLDSLKSKAAQAISTLGSGTSNVLVDRTHNNNHNTDNTGPEELLVEMEPINIYDVIHAAWDLRVQRLEEFAARYLANRLEDYIDEPDFQELIRESADRLKSREETDTIELLDDIRYYLGERFRLRFEDAGLEDMMDENGEISAEMAAELATSTEYPQTTPNGSVDNISAGTAPLADNSKDHHQQHTVTPTQNGLTTVPPPPAQQPSPSPNMTAAAVEEQQPLGGGEDDDDAVVTTLDGATAEDEFASDAINYQILLGKIDIMLDRLKLDA